LDYLFGVRPTTGNPNEELRKKMAVYKTDQQQSNKLYGPIGEWNVYGVTDMSGLFADQPDFNEDIGSWNVSTVLTMSGMFHGCLFSGAGVGRWNVSNVTNMTRMFEGCIYFIADLSHWTPNEVTNTSYMFSGCSLFNNGRMPWWTLSKVTDMRNMFYISSDRAIVIDPYKKYHHVL
jgi:hypothetical protein